MNELIIWLVKLIIGGVLIKIITNAIPKYVSPKWIWERKSILITYYTYWIIYRTSKLFKIKSKSLIGCVIVMFMTKIFFLGDPNKKQPTRTAVQGFGKSVDIFNESDYEEIK